MGPLEGQILEELCRPIDVLGRLLGLEAVDPLRRRVGERVTALAETLTSGDQVAAAATTRSLMGVLFPRDVEPPHGWWRTPLGRACAVHCADHQPPRIQANVAAEILGVGPSRVYQLLGAGKLDRHPDGGVTRSSVMRRVAQQD
jgi:hypothetical protein